MAGLQEFQKKMAEDRAKMLEKRVNLAVDGPDAQAPAPAPVAGGGMAQADFGGPKAKPTDKQNKQLADLLRKRMAEDAADRKNRGE